MKIINFLIGLVVLFMGLLPFLAKIEAVASRIRLIEFIGEPGKTVYQLILIVLGVLVIAYSLKKPTQKA